MENENSKTNFFKQLLKSVKDLDKYEDFALEAPKTAFKYFFKLILIFSAIVSIFYTYKIVENANSIYSNLKNKLPDFSYTHGNLEMDSEEPIVIEDYTDLFGKIIIDTNITANEAEKYEQEKDGILLLKDRFLVLSTNTMGQVSYSYKELAQNYQITDFTKQDAINYVESMNIVAICMTVYFIIFVYLFIVYFISIFLDVLLLSILALIVSRISRIKLKFTPSFGIAIHSITLPVILNLIYIIANLLTGFKIKYFQLMYSTISYIYVIVAVLMIKTDFINRQIELMKLAEEQEKIKEEMERKKQEEEKEKQEENKKPEEKKSETKEKKKAKRKKKQEGNEEGNEEGTGADAPAFEEMPKE